MKLTQEFNKQDGDFTEKPNPGIWLNVSAQNEDNKIGELLVRSLVFPDGELAYVADPEPGFLVYNSNSFMRGLLNVCQIESPSWFTDLRFPGRDNPVPAQYLNTQQ